MIYYKVPFALDGYRRRHGRPIDCTTWIYGELYTARELEKLGASPAKFERVNASKKQSYYFFGARFNSDLQKEGGNT